MDSELRQKAIDMRKQNCSYSEIKIKLGVPKSTLCYWLKEYPLSKEVILKLRQKNWTKGEASRERYRETRRLIKEERNNKEFGLQKIYLKDLPKQAHYVAGLMLYLGEGDKKNETRISLANTDPWIIKYFVWWLTEFFEIEREKIKIQLHLYESMDLEYERNFWENILSLPRSQFYKPSIRSLTSKSYSYNESYRHGTCAIYVMGVVNKLRLMASIKAFEDLYGR